MYLFLESIESRFTWITFEFKLWFTFCWNFSAWKRPKFTTRRGIQHFSVLLMLKYLLFESVILCKSVFVLLSLLYILLTVDRDDPESVEICFEDIKCLDPEGYLTSTIMNFYIRLVEHYLDLWKQLDQMYLMWLIVLQNVFLSSMAFWYGMIHCYYKKIVG